MNGFRRNAFLSICNRLIVIASFTLIICFSICHKAAAASPTSSPGAIYVCLEPSEPLCWRMDQLPDKEPVMLPNGDRLVRKGEVFIIERPWRSGDMPKEEWWPYVELRSSAISPDDLDLVAQYQHVMGRAGGVVDADKLALPCPVPLFIHRMTDPRIMDFSRLRGRLGANSNNNQNPSNANGRDANSSITLALLNLSKSMIADRPTDCFAEVFYMDALANLHDARGLRGELKRWGPKFEPQPMLRMVKRRMEETARALELSASGKNAYDFVQDMWKSKNNLATRIRMMPGILRCDGFARPYLPLPPQKAPYLDFQVSMKIYEVGSVMFLLQGDRQRALDTSASDYRLGQLMNQNGMLINRLIGIAIRGIATRGMELYFLNACESPEDVLSAWPKLEHLNQLGKPQTKRQMFYLESLSCYIDESEWQNHKMMAPNTTEAIIRQTVADSRFQLVRMAASAWHVFLKKSKFPAADGQFELLTDGLPPKDPFGFAQMRFRGDDKGLTTYSLGSDAKDTRLLFREGDAGLACYSVGPDGKDDGALIDYDPTNGTISPGDIVTEVPRARKYPFPRDGVKAADKFDFLSQFPDNLPPDPFADKKGTPLGVTNTSPVYVYSFGPDTNQSTAKPLGDAYFPDALYDPTNGTFSKGDLVCVIPKP